MQDPIEAVFVAGADEPSHQAFQGQEQDRVASLDGLDAEGDGQVSLADAGRAEQDDVLGALDEAQASKFPQLLAIDGGLEIEIKLVQRLHPGQAGQLEPALDAPLVAATPLGFRFSRALPVSAYGQTSLHDRLGFDHRNALDVAVHPDSAEGRALMDFLRAAGIPFIASWGAVLGSTSGAHIHVGQPSPRLTGRR